MLTPRFSLDQDDNFLTITIYAPFTNLSDTEIFIEENHFRFFSKPYFLRLHLPGDIEDNDNASGTYDADTCSFIVRAPKKNPGEKFEGLELLTELLKPKGSDVVAGKIEVISQSENNGESNPDDGDEEIDWYFDQELPIEEDHLKLGTENCGYGFGFKRVQVFSKLLEECQEILDIKDPDSLNYAERRSKRLEMESQQFDSDHYLCDLFESDEIESYWKSQSPWSRDLEEEELKLTKDERERLIGLPNKLDIDVCPEDVKPVFYGLLDILFAYLYDNRVTDGEHSTESGWAFAKLSPTLSCCEKFVNLKDVLVACARRSLIFPLYRHWKLTKSIFQDLSHVLQQGKVSILKILLKIVKVFANYEGRHIFNELYLHQYVAWIQTVKTSSLITLSKKLDATIRQLTKEDLDLDLIELESAAKLVLAEESAPKVALVQNHARCESDDSDDSNTEDSSSDSDSSSDTSDSDSTSGNTSDCVKPVKTSETVENLELDLKQMNLDSRVSPASPKNEISTNRMIKMDETTVKNTDFCDKESVCETNHKIESLENCEKEFSNINLEEKVQDSS